MEQTIIGPGNFISFTEMVTTDFSLEIHGNYVILSIQSHRFRSLPQFYEPISYIAINIMSSSLFLGGFRRRE